MEKAKYEQKFVIHTLKTDPEVFEAVLLGLKKYEIRFNDRGFRVGDDLCLSETKYTGQEMEAGKPLVYTARTVNKTIAHILHGPI